MTRALLLYLLLAGCAAPQPGAVFTSHDALVARGNMIDNYHWTETEKVTETTIVKREMPADAIREICAGMGVRGVRNMRGCAIYSTPGRRDCTIYIQPGDYEAAAHEALHCLGLDHGEQK